MSTIVEKTVNNSKINDIAILNPIVEKSSSQRTTTDITLDVKPEPVQAHDPFLDEMVKHQQKNRCPHRYKSKIKPTRYGAKSHP